MSNPRRAVDARRLRHAPSKLEPPVRPRRTAGRPVVCGLASPLLTPCRSATVFTASAKMPRPSSRSSSFTINGMRREAGLLADGLDDFRVAVARARDPDPTREIDELVAVGVPDAASQTLDEDALREALDAGEEFRGRRDSRFFRSL